MRWILLIGLIPALLVAQNVLGVQNRSVMIRNAGDTGEIGEEKWVVRPEGEGLIPLGKVKIHKSVDDLLLADITTLLPGCQIAIGDQVTDGLTAGDAAAPAIQRSTQSISTVTQQNTFIGTPGWTRRLQFGLSSGAMIPCAVINDLSPTSYQAGVFILYSPREHAAIMLEATYSVRAREISLMLPQHDAYNPAYPFVFNVNAVFRHGMWRRLHADFGAGGYISKIALMADTKQRSVQSLEYYYGVCGGMALECIRTHAWSLWFLPRYHVYYAGKTLVDHVTVGAQLMF